MSNIKISHNIQMNLNNKLNNGKITENNILKIDILTIVIF
jgi:hypothetical protein